MPALPNIAGGIELTLALIGAVLLWRFELRPAVRAHRASPALGPWLATIPQFLTFLLYVVGCSFLMAFASGVVVRFLPLAGDEVTVFNGSLAQLGMLGGVLAYGAQHREEPSAMSRAPMAIFKAGVGTFLMALPVLIATAKAWEIFLQLCGLPVDRQDLIGMFRNAESFWLLAIMVTLAIVIAPLTEEFVFRAGLFRYFRTRIPHWAALLLPAIFFATLHVNWSTLQGLSSLAPLTVLAMIFSIAYERTGHIGVPIVAHAVFNFHTVLLIFAGVDQ